MVQVDDLLRRGDGVVIMTTVSAAAEIVPELLRRRASAEPSATAVLTDGCGSLTYRSWDERSNATARGLVARGVGRGDRVVLLFDGARWIDRAVSYVAVHKAGAVAVPLGPRFAPRDLVRVIEHCAPTAIVCPRELIPVGWADRAAALSDLEAGHGTEEFQVRVGPGAPAELLYGTGAMRPPEAYAYSHGDLLAGARLGGMGPSTLPAGPFLHAFLPGSSVGQAALRLALWEGHAPTMVLPVVDAERFCELLAGHRATACGLSSAAAGMLLESGAPGRHDLSSVTQVVLTGATSRRPVLVSALSRAFPCASVLDVDAPGTSEDQGPGGQSGCPVAPSQEGMVWHEQFAPASFNLPPLVRRYKGSLDIGALEAAIGEIIRRHGSLRARFAMAGGRALQVVEPPQPLELPVLDLSHLSPPEREAELRRAIAEARGRPFDLIEGRLFEPRALRLGADDHVVIIRLHHSVFDDWSVGVFRRELSALYTAFAHGSPSPLPEPPVQFADFARRQRHALDGDRGMAERSFWKRELAGAPLSVQLPIDDPDQPEGSPHAAADPMSLELPAELAHALRRLAGEHRGTTFLVALAAFAVLVHRYTGLEDVVLSSLVANRNRTQLEGLIGCFAKKVPLRLRVSGDPTFPELLARTRQAVMGALAHQDLAYEAAIREGLGADAGLHGLVPQVGVKFQSAVTPVEQVQLPGLVTSGVPPAARTSRPAHFLAGESGEGAQAGEPAWGGGLYLNTFLGLSVSEADGGIRFTTEGVFHPPAVARLLAHLRVLLAGIAAAPERRISEHDLLDDAERSELVHGWNATGTGSPGEACPSDAFEAQAARTPDRVAVTFEHRSLTYAELDRRADRLALRLRAAGVRARTAVGVCLGPSLEVVVAVLGIWKADCAYVALDPAEAEQRVGFVARDAGVEIAVASAGVAEVLHRPHGLTVVDPCPDTEADDGAPTRPPTYAHPDHPACLFYGSGSSAVSGGVEIGQSSVVNLWTGHGKTVYEGGGGDDAAPAPGIRLRVPAVPTRDSFLRQLVALFGGHTLHLVPDRVDAGTVVSELRNRAVDAVDCTPGELRDLLRAGLPEAVAARAADGVSPVVVMASRRAVDAELWRAWRRMGGASCHVVFGPPECTFAATSAPAAGAPARLTIGRPVGNARCHVLDRLGRPVPIGVAAELHVGGLVLARAYLGRPDLTNERFVPDPFGAPQDRLYRTGHLARYRPDGSIELLGRIDDHVDLRGFPVQPGRIEAVLADCPGVHEVAVVSREDIPGDLRLVAYVVAEDGTIAPTLAQLRCFLWSRLPGYAWPAALVVLGALPRLAGGRVDRAALPPAPGPDAESPGQEPGLLEQGFLAASWAEILEVDRVGAGESYWQRFSFLDALAHVHGTGMTIRAPHVTRNRTIETLAVAVAVDRTRPAVQG